MSTIILGTRGSPLALAQAGAVATLLEGANPGLRVEQKIIKTSGDVFTQMSLAAEGGKGLFTKEIEEQLLRGEIQLAVHSLKDLPTMLPPGLLLGAVPAREDAHDVLISARYPSLEALPIEACVATSSIRRRAQLLARRPDLRVVEIRGNVGTRLKKLETDPSLDALVLAAAGLKRLGLWDQLGNVHRQVLSFDGMIPAVGQGALGCEVHVQDFRTQECVSRINDANTQACTDAERTYLRALGGGCQVPYAGHAVLEGDRLRLIAAVFDAEGGSFNRTEVEGAKSDPVELGERAARQVRP